ncbi:MAG: hypothetical protein GF329_15840 [Candidatus Lokiarchaeota archaeon]|nr:hypothetical protein [Candidatus Lokiarchaeota archaeon]
MLKEFKNKSKKISFISNRFSKLWAISKKLIKFIPRDDTEIQDYISSSDLIIGKTGYSLVSEVIGYQIPFFYTIREKWIEDVKLKRGIENYGLGKFFSRSDLLNGQWINELSFGLNLNKSKPQKNIEKYGQDFIAQYIIDNF